MKLRTELEQEVRWLDFVLMAIGGRKWKSVYEVWERLDAIIPPHAVYRKHRYKSKTGQPVTFQSYKLTVIGAATRYAIRQGMVERTVPIQATGGRNIGNYSLRLTDHGKKRLNRIKRYLCADCLHTGITKALDKENATCGHCSSRHLTYY